MKLQLMPLVVLILWDNSRFLSGLFRGLKLGFLAMGVVLDCFGRLVT